MYFSPLPFFLYHFKTHRDENKIVNDDNSKRSSKRFSSFFSFFLSCETEVRPSRIERSRRLGKQKLGQDLPQRGTKGRAARKAARNRGNSSVRLTLVFLLFPHSLLLWRPTMMNNAATPKDSQKAVVRFVGGKIWIPSFRSNPHPPPSRTFSVHLPFPSLSRLFSSFSKRASERARPVGVGHDKCLPQVSGKQRRHDKCIAFHRSSLSLDEKQPVSLESANPMLRASKLSSTVKFELIDTFCGYLLPDSKGGILFIVGRGSDCFSLRVDRRRMGSMENWESCSTMSTVLLDWDRWT